MTEYKHPPVIIDVEASGFGPDSYPIEVGVALDNGEKYCALVQPAPNWTHWDPNAEQVHRVPRDILMEYGKPMRTVAGELNHLLKGKNVYTDGWVVDNPWLIKLYAEAGMNRDFAVRALEMILSEDQMNIWHETKDKCVAALELRRHRASNDAVLIQQTFIKTKEAVSDKTPDAD